MRGNESGELVVAGLPSDEGISDGPHPEAERNWTFPAREALFTAFEKLTAKKSQTGWGRHHDKVLFLPDPGSPLIRMVHHEKRDLYTDESKGRGLLLIDVEDDEAPESIRHRRFIIENAVNARISPPRDTVFELEPREVDGTRYFIAGYGRSCEPAQARDLRRYLSDRAGLELPPLLTPVG